MAKKRKLRQELSKFARKTEKPLELISGALGIYIGGKQYVDVPNRSGYVFVRLRNNISELIQAHNQIVSPVYDLPVLVVWNHNRYEIYGRDSIQYGSYWDTVSSFLPRHGSQHEFDPDNNGGGDLVFVHGEQFYPMMTFPSGTDGANTVLIAPYRYFYQGLWRYTGNTGVGDLLALGPTGGNNAKLLLVGVTSATGNPFIKQGSEFSEGITGAAAFTQFVPTSLTPIDEIPGAIIRLVTGTETITWANIYDARQYMGILQAYTGTGGGGGGGTIGIYGQDEAAGLGTGTVFNVVGDNISLSISGTVLTLAHTNPTGTPHSFLDLTDTPDSYSGQGSKYVAVNSGATALEFVLASPGGGGNSGVVIYDDSVYKVTGSAISFDSNLSVIVTGSIAFVSAANAATLSNSNLTLTTSGTTSATANTRYFADISGLPGDAYFALPSGTVGDIIELHIITGDDTYELIVKGAATVTINGGSAATEWSRVFITGEVVKFVAQSTTNWVVTYDGRVPCVGLMTLSADDTTNTAATQTLPTWDNKVIDIGNLADTSNYRFNIRRAGYYKTSGLARMRTDDNLTDGKYYVARIYKGGTGGTLIAATFTTAAATNNYFSAVVAPVATLLAVGDYVDMWYQPEDANKGISTSSYFQIEEM